MTLQGLLLYFVTFLAKAAGFSRDLVLSYFYGAGDIVDAYVIATTIPMVIFSFVGTGVQTTLIPMLAKVERKKKSQDRFVSNIINFFAIFCLIAIILVLLFTEPVVALFASGFDEDTMQLAVSFTRFSITGIFFSTLVYTFTGMLHYQSKMVAAAVSTILMDLTVLVFVILSHHFGLYFLPIGNVAALFIQAAFLRFFIQYRYKFVLDRHDDDLISMIKIIIPVIIGVSVNQLNLLIDQTMASHIMSGGISYLNYAGKVLAVVQGVFILTFVSMVYPKMSQMLISRDVQSLTRRLERWLVSLEFFVIPCTVIFCLYGTEIIRLLFYRGNFTLTDVGHTATVLLVYTVQLPFYAVREIVVRVYYAGGNSKLPLVNSTIGLVVKVLAALLLIRTLGLAALPVSTTLSCVITFLFISLKYIRDYCSDKGRGLIRAAVGSGGIFLAVFCSIAMAIAWLVSRFFDFGAYGFIVVSAASFVVYFALFAILLMLKPGLRQYLTL